MPQYHIAEGLDRQIGGAYQLIHKERFGSLSRADAARLVLAMLPEYIEMLFDRFSGQMGIGGDRNKLLGRYYYVRAAALWLAGHRERARESYARAFQTLKSAPEKELCDNLPGLGVG